MNIKLLPVLVSLGMAGAALTARADVADFSFSGSGVSGQGTITYTTVSGGADTVTGATGTFVDSNVGYNGKPSLVSATITGVYAINPVDPLPEFVTAPDFSQYAIAGGVPSPPAADPSTSLSYDNNIYPAGSPIVCTDYPASGGFVDVYGLLFTLSNGDVLNLWSNGVFPGAPGPATYGIALADTNNTYDYVNDVSAVPEPASLALFAGAGLVLARRRRAKLVNSTCTAGVNLNNAGRDARGSHPPRFGPSDDRRTCLRATLGSTGSAATVPSPPPPSAPESAPFRCTPSPPGLPALPSLTRRHLAGSPWRTSLCLDPCWR